MVGFNPYFYVDDHYNFLLDGCTCLSFLQCKTYSGKNKDNMKTTNIKKCIHLCLKPAVLLTNVFLFFGLTTAEELELPDSALPLISSVPLLAYFCLHFPWPHPSTPLLWTVATVFYLFSLSLLSYSLDPACSILFLRAQATLLHDCHDHAWLPFTYQQRSNFSAHSGSVLSLLSPRLALNPFQMLCGGEVNVLLLVIVCSSAFRVSPHIQYTTSLLSL